jgi:hypothetical protein
MNLKFEFVSGYKGDIFMPNIFRANPGRVE